MFEDARDPVGGWACDNVLVFIRQGPFSRGPASVQPLDYTPRQSLMNRRVTLARWDEIPLDKVTEMVSRKVVAGTDLSLTQAYLKKGTLVPLHTLGTEQCLYVLQGAIRLVVDGADLTIREGEVAVIPAGASRQAESLDDTFCLVAMIIGGNRGIGASG